MKLSIWKVLLSVNELLSRKVLVKVNDYLYSCIVGSLAGALITLAILHYYAVQ